MFYRTHIPNEAEYLGEFIEERKGIKGVAKKWETFIPLERYNEQINKAIATVSAKKIDDTVPLGKLEIVSAEASLQ